MTAHGLDDAVREWAGAVEHMTRKYTGPGGNLDADDVRSDAWLGVLTALRDFDPARGELRPTVFARIHTAIVDGKRKRGHGRPDRPNQQPRPPTVPLDLLEPAGAEERGFARVEDADEARRLLARMNPRHARAMLAVHYHDQDVVDVAAELGVCPKRVSQLLKAGRLAARSDRLAAGSAPAGTLSGPLL